MYPGAVTVMLIMPGVTFGKYAMPLVDVIVKIGSGADQGSRRPGP